MAVIVVVVVVVVIVMVVTPDGRGVQGQQGLVVCGGQLLVVLERPIRRHPFLQSMRRESMRRGMRRERMARRRLRLRLMRLRLRRGGLRKRGGWVGMAVSRRRRSERMHGEPDAHVANGTTPQWCLNVQPPRSK